MPESNAAQSKKAKRGPRDSMPGNPAPAKKGTPAGGKEGGAAMDDDADVVVEGPTWWFRFSGMFPWHLDDSILG